MAQSSSFVETETSPTIPQIPCVMVLLHPAGSAHAAFNWTFRDHAAGSAEHSWKKEKPVLVPRCRQLVALPLLFVLLTTPPSHLSAAVWGVCPLPRAPLLPAKATGGFQGGEG